MRITAVTDKFARLESRSGCGMRSVYDGESQAQQLKFRGTLIAEIYNYQDPKNFRLRLYPRGRYMGKTEYVNRMQAVLVSIQTKDITDSRWEHIRYTSFCRYDVKIYDRKLDAEYKLRQDHPMEFAFVDGSLTLDYRHLESRAFPDKPVIVIPTPDSNSNLTSVSNKLTAILAGV